jgi:two-component system, NtrC family, response regulator HydG
MSARPPDRLRILIVDDESVVRDSLAGWFEEDGHTVKTASDARSALTLIRSATWDIALVDIKMPGMDGLELQRRIHEAAPQTTVIIMTAFASVDTAVQALKEGAYDYIVKPFDPEHLSHLVRKTSERNSLVRENLNLKYRLANVAPATPILGESPAIRRALELIETVAATDTTVLITGESGSGKELVARAVHEKSARSLMPLVVVNCGALPEGTLESELFGHERGAFTGALYRHKGKFELADGGTLFLDEVAEVSARIQVELLRVLEEKRVTRLGGSQTVRADFRLIAATNKNLHEEMKAGRIREDLYYRLNVFHIHLPPLRERAGDIPILATALVERLARSMNCSTPRISEKAMALLNDYTWPGNVRELANALERALVVERAEGAGIIEPRHLPVSRTAPGAEVPGSSRHAGDDSVTLATMEKRHIDRVLKKVDWNISEAARILDLDRSTVYHKIRQYELAK